MKYFTTFAYFIFAFYYFHVRPISGQVLCQRQQQSMALQTKWTSRDHCEKTRLNIKVFAFDFDKTCTIEPVLDIYKSREDYINSKETLDNTWFELVKSYSKSIGEVFHLLKNDTAFEFDEVGLQKFLSQVGIVDEMAMDRLISSNILKGITVEGLQIFSRTVQLKPGVLTVLKNLMDLGLPLHLISLNFSEQLISFVLNRKTKLPIKIHSNNLVFRDGICTGNVEKKFTTAVHKEAELDQLNKVGSGVIVYVGDSSTDLLALLKADIGIIIGNSPSLQHVCNAFGVEIISLNKWKSVYKYNNDNSRTLFHANSWKEIEDFILRTSNY